MAQPALRALLPGLAGLALLGACASPGLAPSRAAKPLAALPSTPPSPSPQPSPVASYPQERPLDEARPLKVRSKSLRYDQATQESVFYGGVTVTQDSSTLLARELRSQTQGQSAHASGGVVVTDPQRRFRVDADSADYAGALGSARLDGGVRLQSQDPWGVALTVTGRSGEYNDVSRWARVDGGVGVVRGALSATAGSAELLDGGTRLRLMGDVAARLGRDRCLAQVIELDQAAKALEMTGDVRARFVPQDLREAAAQPWKNAPGQEAP